MIEEFKPGRERELSRFVQNVFDEFVGTGYTEEGNRIFREFITPGAILKRYEAGSLILLKTENAEITGMLEVREQNHICLFFVRSDWQKKGVGKELFNTFLKQLPSSIRKIDVNSSPYAGPVYRKLGFTPIAGEQEKSGIRFIPMIFEKEAD